MTSVKSQTDLFRSQTLHVGGLQDVLKIIVQVNDVGVDRHLQQRHGDIRLGIFFFFYKLLQIYLIFPLKLRPHLSELCIGTGSWLDVVHDVDVDVAEDHAVPVASCTRDVVD